MRSLVCATALSVIYGNKALALQKPLQRYGLYEHCVSCLISSSRSTGPCMVDEEEVH